MQALKGGNYQEDTEEQKLEALRQNIAADVEREGAAIIHADEKRLQVFRHKPGQLDSVKDVDFTELEAMRLAAKKRTD